MISPTERARLLGVEPPSEARAGEPLSEYGKSKPYDIVERARLFALDIIDFSKIIYDSGWRPVANQVLRSGTSIGANLNESEQAESRADFLHKVRIAAKEAKEIRYWLSLCRDSPHLPYIPGMFEESDEIAAILSTIIARTIKGGK